MKASQTLLLLLLLPLSICAIPAKGQLFLQSSITIMDEDSLEYSSFPRVIPKIGVECAVPIVYDFLKFNLGFEYSFRYNLTDTASSYWDYWREDSSGSFTYYRCKDEVTGLNGTVFQLYGGPYVELKHFIVGTQLVWIREKSEFTSRLYSLKYPFEGNEYSLFLHDDFQHADTFVTAAILFGLKHKRLSLLCKWDVGYELGFTFRWEVLKKSLSSYSVKPFNR